MFNTNRLAKFLETGEMPLVTALDEAIANYKPTDLESHDKRFHPDGYKEGDACKYREGMAKDDKADEGLSSRKTTLVTPEEDAAYMKAVEDGDMETAKSMVREAAKKAMPNTKIKNASGIPVVAYHFTKTPDDFYVFDRDKSGPGMFGKSFYFFTSYRMAENWGNFNGEKRKIVSTYLNIEKPWVDSLGGYDDNTGFDKAGLSKPTDAEYQSLVDNLKEKGYELNPDYSYDGITPYKYSDGKRMPINNGLAFLSNALTHDTDKGGFGWKYAEPVRQALEELGYDGVIGELDGFTQIAAFKSSQIKSADPITYDDDGKVIPLSRRFDKGNDIRGAVKA